MSRLTWFVAGAATGVYGLVRARRAAHTFTPDGLAARAAAVSAGLRVLASEVSAGMAEREGELRHQLSLTPSEPRLAVPPRIESSDDSRLDSGTDGHGHGHR
jgi:Family of unknown function (DUF6167)